MLAQSTTLPAGMRRPRRARQQPPQGHTRAGVDGDDLPATVDAGQLDLVGPDQPGPLEVDQVAGAEVLRQQHLPGPPLEALEAHGVAHELHPAGLEVGDAGDGDEQLAAGDADHDAGHRRVRGEAQLGDEVLDPAEAVPVPVHERAPDHARQVQDLDGHPWRSSSDAVRVAALNLVDPLSLDASEPGRLACAGAAAHRQPPARRRLRPRRDPWEADRP